MKQERDLETGGKANSRSTNHCGPSNGQNWLPSSSSFPRLSTTPASSTGCVSVATEAPQPATTEDDRVQLARALIALGALRCRLFEDLTESAVSMLLDLYVLDYFVTPELCISSLSATSGASVSTALRYINTLEQKGFVSIREDTDDRRRRCVRLTERGRQQVADYLACADKRLGALIQRPSAYFGNQPQ